MDKSVLDLKYTLERVEVLHPSLVGGVAYVEIYVEACGSLFEATAVATKGTWVPPSFRYN